jgi:hypothetical protein
VQEFTHQRQFSKAHSEWLSAGTARQEAKLDDPEIQKTAAAAQWLSHYYNQRSELEGHAAQAAAEIVLRTGWRRPSHFDAEVFNTLTWKRIEDRLKFAPKLDVSNWESQFDAFKNDFLSECRDHFAAWT